MQFSLSMIAFLAANAGVAFGAAACGNLGVMSTEGLPDGINPAGVRACAEFPGAAGTHDDGTLEKRDCWYGKAVGCTDGYCWKQCGKTDGPWCWTAREGGFGDWYTCSRDSDCKKSMACGQAVDGCDKCGCSC